MHSALQCGQHSLCILAARMPQGLGHSHLKLAPACRLDRSLYILNDCGGVSGRDLFCVSDCGWPVLLVSSLAPRHLSAHSELRILWASHLFQCPMPWHVHHSMHQL